MAVEERHVSSPERTDLVTISPNEGERRRQEQEATTRTGSNDKNRKQRQEQEATTRTGSNDKNRKQRQEQEATTRMRSDDRPTSLGRIKP
jgi:hypothetical protein